MSALRAAAIFTDHMVIQMGKPVAVWGHTYSGRIVTVSFCGMSDTVVCTDNTFKCVLPPVDSYGGPYEMTISDGEETLTFRDIMVGEVWIAGGQSNMELELQNEVHGKEELQALCKDVRFYYTKKLPYMDEFFYIDERNGGWMLPDEMSSRNWSAVGYYFGKRLAQDLDVTIGIIGCNWGGTSASNWVDREQLAHDDELRSYNDEYDAAMEGKTFEQYCDELREYNEYVAKWEPKIAEFYAEHPDGSWEDAQAYAGPARYPEPMGPKSPFRPGGLYRTMLCRIAPYSVRGTIYYQGESDDHKPAMYRKLFTLLIDSWRRLWNDDIPFIFVQLPMHRWTADPDLKNWCVIRKAQEDVYRFVRGTGMAVALDCGEFNNIHPVDKTQVGARLAMQALYMIYGRLTREQATSPMCTSCYRKGGSIVLCIENASGWDIRGDIDGFEISGEDGVYHTAEAVLEPGRITVTCADVPHPTAVRYKWTNYAEVCIYGSNGLPLAPIDVHI
ncbi:MAG: sialate O-acetylesterase [Oscillospiraceae bacterium]|nr:sialate O-acetylesterase [Oscillospiraceae bacterium]